MKKINHILLFFLIAIVAGGCEKDDTVQPVACFDVDSSEVLENQTVAFTNCSEDATAYYWEFGDGETSIEFDAEHAYQTPGTYDVTLTVFHEEESDQHQMTITVEEDPTPVACFTVETTNVPVNEEVAFTDCSEKADTYLWDFGDGNTSTDTDPVHVYTDPGEVEVVLTVENDHGEDSMSMTLTVIGDDVAFQDNFDEYEDFALSFGDWTQIDNDGSTTWGLAATDFPNSGYVGSFIIFNPSETDPPVDDDERFEPYSGEKYAAAFAAQDPPNDDWLISPEFLIDDTGYELSLAVKSYSDAYGTDYFVIQVLVGDETHWLSPENDPVAPPTSWAEYSYDLSDFAGEDVQIQIGCVSDDAVAMFVDDIEVKSAAGKTLLKQDFNNAADWQEPVTTPSDRE